MSCNHFKVISYLLNKPDIYAVVATHNEKAVADIVEMLKRKTEFNTIVFGQIYGMGEQITMPLGEYHIVPKFTRKNYYESIF